MSPHLAFVDITYTLVIRRKTLFYSIFLVVPSISISFLSVLVFYLPADSGEKMTLCVSILISLAVFFLLLVDLIPSTSLVIPLIGKYLLFTIILVTLSIVVTVANYGHFWRPEVPEFWRQFSISTEVHYRRQSSFQSLPPWVKRLFIDILPRYLLIERPPIIKLTRLWPKPAQRGAPPPQPKKISVITPFQLTSQMCRPNLEQRVPQNPWITRERGSYRRAAIWQACEEQVANLQGAIHSNIAHRLTNRLDVPSNTRNSSATSRSSHLSEEYTKPQHQHNDPTQNHRHFPTSTKRVKRKHDHPSCRSMMFTRSELDGVMANVDYIRGAIHNLYVAQDVEDDFRYIAIVIDRLFLVIFSIASIIGTLTILLQAPSLFENTQPISTNQREFTNPFFSGS